jgi:hypothetical protein
VIGQSGNRLRSQVVETNAKALIEVVRAVPKDRHLYLEEYQALTLNDRTAAFFDRCAVHAARG